VFCHLSCLVKKNKVVWRERNNDKDPTVAIKAKQTTGKNPNPYWTYIIKLTQNLN
jgi:hypothetical protein